MSEVKQCLGECPECGSESIVYDDPKFESDYMAYPAECDDCGLEFEENFEVSYTGTTYER